MRIAFRSTVAVLALAACRSEGTGDAAADPRSVRVAESLRPAAAVKGEPAALLKLADEMAARHVPGVSIAVAESGRIVWARGFGLKQVGTSDAVTATTLFQAGSISKPVAATAMLRLVERGTLSLDSNVNQYLKSWKVPDNKFTAKEKVTLRRIVSHNAGLTVHGFPGYSTTDAVPTLPQVLDGAKPANTDPVRVDTFPGAIWRYAGGGTTVMQLLLTDVTGKPFPQLLQDEVLGPAKMTRSTYEQPLPAARQTEASAAHHGDGTMVPGRWHIYPEMAAAGLWTTPSDLLTWAFAIADARAGRSTALLSQGMATQMLTMQKAPTGLGPFLDGSGKGFSFGHNGADEGFLSLLVYFPETGQGAAVMVNGDGGGALLGQIRRAIAAEYHWPETVQREVEPLKVQGTVLDELVGTYTFGKPAITITISRGGDTLWIADSQSQRKGRIVLVAPDKVISLNTGSELTFERDKRGRVSRLALGDIKAMRVKE
jgi:CubicO group peptidase (beta-lactamase class C family)